MTKKWIGPLVLGVLLIMPVGSLNAALDEGNFVPCYGDLAASFGDAVYYSIQTGDTLSTISVKCHTDMNQLKEVNNLDDQSILTVGGKLLIPTGDNPVHIIKSGETLWDVSKNYGISLDQLYALNPGIEAENLKLGASLTLPPGSHSGQSDHLQPSRGSLMNSIFSWPIIGAITSAYGRRHAGFHHGLDIAAELGEPIRAAANGRVSFTGWQGVYGKMIIIDHPDGRQTAYAHLSRIDVSSGSQVSRGDVIGNVGVTGNSTGPHLHFEVRQGKQTINPASVLR